MAASAPLIRDMGYAAIVARLAEELERATARLDQAAVGRIRVLDAPDGAGARHALIGADEAQTIGGPVLLAGWLAPDTLVRAAADTGEYVYLRRPPDALWALVCVFAHMQETVIARLNRVPENLLHTFLNSIGTRIQPPSPARAPLSFQVATGFAGQSRVPAGTLVAAPAAGRPEQIFATEQALPLTSAHLVAAFAVTPEQYADYNDALRDGEPFAPFQGDLAYQHCLSIAQDAALGLAAPKKISLILTTANQLELLNALEGSSIELTTADGNHETLPCVWKQYAPDPHKAPTGVCVELERAAGVAVPGLDPTEFPALDLTTPIGGITGGWLTLMLPQPLNQGAEKIRIAGVSLSTRISADVAQPNRGVLPEAAVANTAPIELTRPLLPFGERPRPGDVFYLRCPEAVLRPNGVLSCAVKLANQPSPQKLEVVWEIWNGRAWEAVKSKVTDAPELLKLCVSGTFTLYLPATIAPVKVGGVPGYWLRARIVQGDFGGEARYKLAPVPNTNPEQTPYYYPNTRQPLYLLESAAAVPPLVEWLRLGAEGEWQADHVLLRHGPVLRDITKEANGVDGPFRPFNAPADPAPALYLGFDAPFANGPVSLYLGVEPAPAAKEIYAAPAARLELAWEYAAADGSWRELPIADETDALSVSGLVSFIGPADLAARTLFDRSHHWLRVRCVGGAPDTLRLGRVLTNTTWASQARAVERELLGASDGRQPGLTLRASAPPVLPGQLVEVREAPDADWVAWAERPDLYAAGPWERQYVLDRLTGELRFGDGVRGMVPPRGTNNIRISYSTGGGAAGNLPAGTISKLKVAVPYIDAVTNRELAAGGADTEPAGRARERGAHELRHSGRAVAAQDYEDMALAATPEVARALALVPEVDPFYEQDATPDDEAAAAQKAGQVRLVIVPHADSPGPLPSPELLRRVRRYVDARRPPEIDFDVLPPVYVPVEVTATVAVRSPEDGAGLAERVSAAISRYLHPLYGGSDGRGWPFGRLRADGTSVAALRSDLYALIAALAGVDRVARVDVALDPQDLKPGQWRYALLSPNPPQVTLAGS